MEKYAKYRIDAPASQALPSNRWSKYKISSDQSDLELLAKSAASGLLGTADLPQTVLTGAEWLGNKIGAGLEKAGIGKARESNFFSSLPLASSKIKENIKNYTGVDLQPRPRGSGQRILSHAGEFAGGSGLFGLLNKGARLGGAAKLGASGAGIGAGSGILQEEGVNPLVADIGTSIAFPIAAGSGRNLLNKFTPAYRKSVTEAKVANALRSQIGEENLPAVLENIENYKRSVRPIDLNLTTAEIAQDSGLARLARTQSNSPLLAQANIENDAKLVKALRETGRSGIDESVRGETIRAPFVDKYNKSLEARHNLTRPLYEKLELVEEGIDPINAKALLEKEIEVASPGNKAALEKYYTHLADNPRPIQIENTVQELGDKVNAYARAGENNAARKYRAIKDAYERDLATNPAGLTHREEYRRLSAPINEIETSSLLNNFVKKNRDVNKADGFVVSSEKIPASILKADLADTKLLINKAKGNKELLDLVKGAYIDELLRVSTLNSGKLSYDKANKFLTNKYNKEKIGVIFNKKEKQKLNQFLDSLKKRNNVDNAGKVSGSDTHQKFKVEDDIKHALRGAAEQAALGYAGLGGLGSVLWNTGKNALKSKYNGILEESLVSPDRFTSLIQNPSKIKGFKDFYDPRSSFIGPILSSRVREE